VKNTRPNNSSENGLLQHNFGIVDIIVCMYMHTSYIYIFFPMARQPLVCQGRLIIEAARSHSDTPQSVGLVWTSDQPFAKKQHSQVTHFHAPVGIRTSNPSKEAAPRPKPWTGQTLRWAMRVCVYLCVYK